MIVARVSVSPDARGCRRAASRALVVNAATRSRRSADADYPLVVASINTHAVELSQAAPEMIKASGTRSAWMTMTIGQRWSRAWGGALARAGDPPQRQRTTARQRSACQCRSCCRRSLASSARPCRPHAPRRRKGRPRRRSSRQRRSCCRIALTSSARPYRPHVQEKGKSTPEIQLPAPRDPADRMGQSYSRDLDTHAPELQSRRGSCKLRAPEICPSAPVTRPAARRRRCSWERRRWRRRVDGRCCGGAVQSAGSIRFGNDG